MKSYLGDGEAGGPTKPTPTPKAKLDEMIPGSLGAMIDAARTSPPARGPGEPEPCTCFHAPEQHGNGGCAADLCPCKWGRPRRSDLTPRPREGAVTKVNPGAPRKASARAHAIARGIVDEYLQRCGGEDWGFTWTKDEERLALRIAQALERVAGHG